MHPEVIAKFEEICAARGVGNSVLEVGAVAADDTLLCMQSVRSAQERIGLNLDGPHTYRGFQILRGDANDMRCFPADRFDTVLCNATLEHDKFFWRTLAEIRRVAKPGALIVIGVPGYTDFNLPAYLRRVTRIPLLGRYLQRRFVDLASSTITLHIHNYPGDFYRFSPQAMEQVFLEGLEKIEVCSVMTSPRIIGSAFKARLADR